MAVVVAALAAAAAAGQQPPASVASGVGSFGGGSMSRPNAVRFGGARPGGYVIRQARPKPPPFGPFVPINPWWYGPVGGYYPPWGWGGPWAGGYAPAPAPVDPPPQPPARVVQLSGYGTAQLTAVFPAPATVTVDGVAQPGGPRKEWVFTSPVLRPGETHTFQLTARWEAGGKAYEAVREVAAKPGDLPRLTVVSGTPVPAGD